VRFDLGDGDGTRVVLATCWLLAAIGHTICAGAAAAQQPTTHSSSCHQRYEDDGGGGRPVVPLSTAGLSICCQQVQFGTQAHLDVRY
jgi:hypothetical protein